MTYFSFVALTIPANQVRIVMEWSTDNTDVELLVTEPSGQVCSPWFSRTPNGGIMSRYLLSHPTSPPHPLKWTPLLMASHVLTDVFFKGTLQKGMAQHNTPLPTLPLVNTSSK